MTTGYASWPLPAVRQAIEENERRALGQAVQALVPRIDAATEAMKSRPGRLDTRRLIG